MERRVSDVVCLTQLPPRLPMEHRDERQILPAPKQETCAELLTYSQWISFKPFWRGLGTLHVSQEQVEFVKPCLPESPLFL